MPWYEKLSNALLSEYFLGTVVTILIFIVTSWIQRKWFADELAHNEIIQNHVEISQKVSSEVTHTVFLLMQMIIGITLSLRRSIDAGKSNDEALKEATKIVDEFEPKIKKKIISLKQYFTYLPPSTIGLIKQLEEKFWEIIQPRNINTYAECGELLDITDDILSEIRNVTANIISREEKLSDLISTSPEDGFAFIIERNAAKELRQVLGQQETEAAESVSSNDNN